MFIRNRLSTTPVRMTQDGHGQIQRADLAAEAASGLPRASERWEPVDGLACWV